MGGETGLRDSGSHREPTAGRARRGSVIPSLRNKRYPETCAVEPDPCRPGISEPSWPDYAGPVETTSPGMAIQLASECLSFLFNSHSQQCNGVRPDDAGFARGGLLDVPHGPRQCRRELDSAVFPERFQQGM